MGLVADRVKDTTITTGTGAYNFVGVAPTGYRTFNSVFSNGNLVEYAVTDGTNWEVGVGAYGFSTGVGFINRTTILASSNAGAAVSWGAGTKEIWCNASAKFLSTPNFRRNLILGGDFATNPWRSGTSFPAFPGGITADGWTFSHGSAAVWTVAKSATAPNFASAGRMMTHSLRITCTTIDSSISSVDFALLSQNIVGYDFQEFAQKPMVLSFWHQHTKAGIYCVHIGNSVDRSYIAEYTQASAGAWELATIAIAATPSAGTWNYGSGTGVRVMFSLVCGSSYQSAANTWTSAANLFATSNQVNTADTVSNEFAVAAVQLEVGTVATAFDSRPALQELMLLSPTALAPRKNAIIGGDFATNPWQRGTTFTGVTTGGFSADRWLLSAGSSAVWTIFKSATAPTVAAAGRVFTDSLHLVVTTIDSSMAAGEFALLIQVIEGYNFQALAQMPMVLSFWHQHTKAGIYCVSVGNQADRSYIAEYTQAVSGAWEFASIAIPASPSAGTWNYTNGAGLRVAFALCCGTTYQSTANSWLSSGNVFATSNQVNAADTVNNHFAITAVQLEPGTVATPFETRTIQEELALCERYYELVSQSGNGTGALYRSGYGSNGTVDSFWLPFRVTKRVNPTISVGVSWYLTNCSSPSMAGFSLTGLVVSSTVGPSTGAFSYGPGASTSVVSASAEL